MRILDGSEIDSFLQAASDRYRCLFAVGLFTGLRSGEIFGLRWGHVDFDAGLLRVREQVDRTGRTLPLKTPRSSRHVVLTPALTHLLRQHRIGSPYSKANDYVFTRPDGRAMHPDVVRKYGLLPTLERALFTR